MSGVPVITRAALRRPRMGGYCAVKESARKTHAAGFSVPRWWVGRCSKTAGDTYAATAAASPPARSSAKTPPRTAGAELAWVSAGEPAASCALLFQTALTPLRFPGSVQLNLLRSSFLLYPRFRGDDERFGLRPVLILQNPDLKPLSRHVALKNLVPVLIPVRNPTFLGKRNRTVRSFPRSLSQRKQGAGVQ